MDKGQIINLTSYKLSREEYSVLQKGLNYVPTNPFSCFDWVKDINIFGRNLKWKLFFQNHDSEQCHQLGLADDDIEAYRALTGLLQEGTREEARVRGKGPFTDLKNRSTRMPPNHEITSIDIFMYLVERDLCKIPRDSGQWSNLSTEESQALKNLEKNKHLIIKASDKGGNLVLMDHTKYLTLCQMILKDKDTYDVLPKNPTSTYTLKLIDILDEAKEKGIISNNEFLYLKPDVPTIPTFYTLPKIHKGVNLLKGRPIVAGIDSLSQNIGIYIDKVLRPFVVSLPSYVRDTSHLLTQLEGVAVEETSYLASIDVEALYSSIPHEAGIQAVGHFLKTMAVECNDHNRLVEDLLRFTLTHNYFLFNDKYFHQLRGTAMVSPCAPTYANLFLGWWEETIILGEDDKWWHPHIGLWARYIDDILVFWSGTEAEFKWFIGIININGLGLSFTYECQIDNIAFLDLRLRKEKDGSISTCTYRKPTATNSLLKWDSNHPEALKCGIPKSQFLRVRRNCSNIGIFREQATDLYNRFHERGYPSQVLDRSYSVALGRSRGSLLVNSKKDKPQGKDILRIIGNFDNQSERVSGILGKHWGALLADPNVKDLIPPVPSIAFKKGNSVAPQGVWLPQW
ncbi:uncharacterized protein [Phyllobates terribilis]|uniref:uncharacterized protein n=1 Tax=Phyllobates terribilis TaxID=111132 RepID=UPI003CCAFA07